MPSDRDDILGLMLVLAIVFGTVALANILPTAVAHRTPSTPASFDKEPTCAEWTDGCIICQRTEQGPACSMPGIACVPRAQACLRREGV